MLSFWERESLSKYDFIVVGAGIVGCSTAYHLKKRLPSADIAIIERGVFPSGASSKNAGFACFGSLTELVDDKKGLDEEQQVALVERRWKGLLALRNILGDKNTGFQRNGGFEIIRSAELSALEYLDHYNQLLKSVFNSNIYSLQPQLTEEFGFNGTEIETIVANPFEGQVDTGKMMKSWWALCNEMGVKIISGCKLKDFEQENDHLRLSCESAGQSFELKAGKMAICTNAFTGKWFSEEDIIPGRGMAMVTHPLKSLKFKGVFHYEEGYFYFRNIGDRVLIGGGRNLAKSTERTTNFGINPEIKSALLHDLKELILPKQDFSIDMEWSGIMAFGKTKSPIIKKVADRIALGVRLGGMGVAIGTQVGQELQELLAD
jgi:glycine/D-amino acid oxidase-like deaminating enzyme